MRGHELLYVAAPQLIQECVIALNYALQNVKPQHASWSWHRADNISCCMDQYMRSSPAVLLGECGPLTAVLGFLKAPPETEQSTEYEEAASVFLSSPLGRLSRLRAK